MILLKGFIQQEKGKNLQKDKKKVSKNIILKSLLLKNKKLQTSFLEIKGNFSKLQIRY